MDRETLLAIAHLILADEHGDYPEVLLGAGAPAATRALLAIGARHSATVYAGTTDVATPYVIESATLTIDGVAFRAQFKREATDDEVAALGGRRSVGTFTDHADVTRAA